MSQMTVSHRGRELVVQERADGFWQRFDDGTWEPWTLQVLNDRLHEGSRYVDIGAWVGPTVLVAAARGAEVEGFEPDPGALPELRANLAANPDLAGRIRINPVALAAKGGNRRLSVRNDAGDSMSSLARRGAGAGFEVGVQPVAEWLNRPEFEAVLVKIDIEGGEYELVPAMRRYLTARRPDLLLSLHSYHLDAQIEQVARFMPRKVAAHGLVLASRRKVAWLAKTYPYVYFVSSNEWQPVDRTMWRRLLHVPANYEFFFTRTPLG